MSKQAKRKITVSPPSPVKVKGAQGAQAVQSVQTAKVSVFDRLGTKSTKKPAKEANADPKDPKDQETVCRQWAQTSGCSFGKACKFAASHVLVSPSKQARLHSAVVRGGERGDDWMHWDQQDLEYADADDLEKRREQLKRELDMHAKKPPSSSSSSRSSSTTSATTSSSQATTSSSSSARETRKKIRRINKSKRDSSSSSRSDRPAKKRRGKAAPKRADPKRPEKRPDDKKRPARKSPSPGKKAGGTPPITSDKGAPKGRPPAAKSRSPKREAKAAGSPSPAAKDRERERERERERKEREARQEREKEKERERERDRKRSKSPRSRARSRSPPPRRRGSRSRDSRRSPDRSRGPSPKGRAADKHRRAASRDDRRKERTPERRKDRSPERRKDRDRARPDREAQREREREEALARCQERQRERERLKEQQQAKRDEPKRRGRDRDRGLNKGLEKPGADGPVERLLPRPEERLAALAATNKSLGLERAASSNRDRDRTERAPRKTARSADGDRERAPKRRADRRDSAERRPEYASERPYGRSRSTDRGYDRSGERYEDAVGPDGEREDGSPGAYPAAEREPRYGSPYDPPARGYLDPDERGYGDHHLDDHHTMERGFIEDRRNSRRDDLSWDGRETSVDPDGRPYMHHSQMSHSHKDWGDGGDDYHSDWNRQDRHWTRDSAHKGHDWPDKERDVDWHHGRPGGSSGTKGGARGRNDESNYRRGTDHGRGDQVKRGRDAPAEDSDTKKPASAASANPQSTSSHSGQTASGGDQENAVVSDDLSEISDGPDEILNRDDEVSEIAMVVSDQPPVDSYGMIDLQPFKPDYEPMIEHTSSSRKSSKDQQSGGQKNHSDLGSSKETNLMVDTKNDQSQEGEDGLDNLDFEEISDGELEEDQRAKGLGDALGVDWASLVAEVRKKKENANESGQTDKDKTGARERWQPQKVLARIGVSLQLAGEEMINEIFAEKPKSEIKQETVVSNGTTGFKISHPVASIQVALERRRQQRISLFGTETGFMRALCARRDLALRRHMCNLPINESGHEVHPPEPHLFAMARKLIQKAA